MSRKSTGKLIPIWDLWTRAFHWALAGSVLFMLVSGETGFLFFDWHRHVGEFVLLLIVFRLIWGLVGSSNIRLHQLVSHPALVLKHLYHLATGQVEQERAHNAAGGWAVLVMLLLVLFQAVSGLFIADEDELIEGKFYGLLNSGTSEQLLHLHHLNAKFIMAVVSLHVLMILIYLLRAGQNLITPMITGKLHWRSGAQPPNVSFTSAWLGLLLFGACVGSIGWLLSWFVT